MVYINGSIKDFYLTVSLDKMLQHHNLTKNDISLTSFACPQFKEYFSQKFRRNNKHDN